MKTRERSGRMIPLILQLPRPLQSASPPACTAFETTPLARCRLALLRALILRVPTSVTARVGRVTPQLALRYGVVSPGFKDQTRYTFLRNVIFERFEGSNYWREASRSLSEPRRGYRWRCSAPGGKE